MGTRMHRGAVVALGVLTATAMGAFGSAGAQVNPINLDPDKGTLDGSPIDDLPPHIELLDIELPDGGRPMRPEWSPDSERVVFLDAPIGNVWEYELATGVIRNVTGDVLPGGTLRSTYLTNGDMVLCAPAERSVDDPQGDRFRGEIWLLPQPLGDHDPIPLGESCWEGIAVSKQPGSTRIAWNQSTIRFDQFPDVFVEALVGESEILTARIDYDADGVPSLVDREVVLEKHDVSPDTPALEAQDFRSLTGDGSDDELLFTAYFTRGGQIMGVDLRTGELTEYAPTSVVYDEAEGIDPAGEYILVERDLTVTLFPGMVDLWRLSLDGSGHLERLTTFSHYEGYGANNAVVAPDGTRFAFSLKIEGEEGEGDGILLYDLTADTSDPGLPGDQDVTEAGAGSHDPPATAAANDAAPAPLPRTGGSASTALAALFAGFGLLAGLVRARARPDRP